MKLSTRNQLTGTVVEVNIGAVMATVKVKLDGGEQIVTASITKEAVADLELESGQAGRRPGQVDRGDDRRRVGVPRPGPADSLRRTSDCRWPGSQWPHVAELERVQRILGR